jgi:hypothetical protein
MTGYLIGKLVTVSGTILISVAATLITGASVQRPGGGQREHWRR